MEATASQQRSKLSWSGAALKALGNVTRDAQVLREIYEEASQLTLNEGWERKLPHVCVRPEHIQRATSTVAKRNNALKAVTPPPARFARTEGGAQ